MAMVQSINWEGISAIWKFLWKPELVLPHLSVENITKINYVSLSKSGIKAIAFDKDNCLTAPYENQLHPPFQNAWSECIHTFQKSNVCIVSNSAGSKDDVDYKEAKLVEENLGVHVLRHTLKKPLGGSVLCQHFGVRPHEIAVVGDRVLTDVVFGNLHGFYSIHTFGIITKLNDNKMASWIRELEYKLITMLRKAGVAPPAHPLKNIIK